MTNIKKKVTVVLAVPRGVRSPSRRTPIMVISIRGGAGATSSMVDDNVGDKTFTPPKR